MLPTDIDIDKLLMEYFATIYHGPKGGVLEDGMVEAFEKWADNLTVDEYFSIGHSVGLASLRSENEKLREAGVLALKELKDTRESGDCGYFDKTEAEELLEGLLATPPEGKGI